MVKNWKRNWRNKSFSELRKWRNYHLKTFWISKNRSVFQLPPLSPRSYAEATLGSGNLKLAVLLPEGEDVNEWVACNAVDFYNQINMLYGTIQEVCTKEQCPVMNAGKKVEYYWADNSKSRSLRLSAPEYCDKLFNWIQEQLDNENIFPSKIGEPFPKNFANVAKTIFRRLFRVYAHIYHSHFQTVLDLNEEQHLRWILDSRFFWTWNCCMDFNLSRKPLF